MPSPAGCLKLYPAWNHLNTLILHRPNLYQISMLVGFLTLTKVRTISRELLLKRRQGFFALKGQVFCWAMVVLERFSGESASKQLKQSNHRHVVPSRSRKFLIESSDRTVRQVKRHPDSLDQSIDPFYNISNPSTKVQCDECKRDITKTTKIMVDELDFCVACFGRIAEFPQQYGVTNKLNFPLFEHEWTAEEELLLFEGLSKHGFGNWGDIADFIGTNKTIEEVEHHYNSVYLSSEDCLPVYDSLSQQNSILSRRGEDGMLVSQAREMEGERRVVQATPRAVAGNQVHSHRAWLTVNQVSKTGSNPAEIIGYMPRRGDFEVEYDNDAQLLLAEMEFNDDDTPEQFDMKMRLLHIYNHKLDERIKRKEFVIGRKLLDIKEQLRLDKTRTREEKQIYNMMKVFARFNPPEEHQALVQGIIKQKQVRQRIEELKELKKKGFRTLAEVEQELESKKRREDRLKKKDNQIGGEKGKNPRRTRKDPTQKTQKRVLFVNHQEEQLCRELNITFKQYSSMKETILREAVRQGLLSRDQVGPCFKIDRRISEGVYDFLVKQEDILQRESSTAQERN